jgi:peptidyl-prolyl cis-trans isomerase C
MNSFKNVLITVSVILLTVGIASAAKKKPAAEKPKLSVAETKLSVAEPNKPAAEPNTVKDASQSDIVVATVNGKEITESQVGAILDARMKQMAGRIPENMKDQYRQQIRKHVVEQLVVEELISQKEKEKGIDVNQSELNQQINKQIAEQNLTMDEFKALLTAYGTSFSNYEQNVRAKLMFEKLIEVEIAGKIDKPTDDQARAYYDENIQQFRKPEKIHTKHILIRPADSNDPNQAKAQAEIKAKNLLKQLQAGADFNDLAKQHSACPSGKNGGDLGMQDRGTFVPEFEKAAYALKPGQLSDIVQTNFGFHIIKLIEHIDAETTSFDSAKDEISGILSDKQKEGLVMEYVMELKAKADVKYTNESDKLEVIGEETAPPARPAPDSPRGEAGKNEPNSK